MGDHFEGKLVSHLGYKGPWELYTLLDEYLREEAEGCNSEINSDNVIDGTNRSINGGSKNSSDGNGSGSRNVCSNSDESNSNMNADNNNKIISKYPPKGSWRILDLGCGSGLVGKIFFDFVNIINLGGEINDFKSEKSGLEKSDDVVVCGEENENEKVDSTKEINKVEDKANNEINENNINNEENKKNKEDEKVLKEIENDKESIRILNHYAKSNQSIMIGVDVSIRMVEIASETRCYTVARRVSLEDALSVFMEKKVENVENNSESNNQINDNTDNDNGNNIDKNDDDNNNNNINTNKNDNKTNNNNDSTTTSNNPPHVPLVPLNLIIAADTFIYIGELGSTFHQIKRALGKDGLFLFSIEDLDRSPMRTISNMNLKKGTGNNDDSDNTNYVSSSNDGGANEKDTKNHENNVNDIYEDEVKYNSILNNLKISNFEPVGAVPGWGGELLKSARFAHTNSYIKILSQIHGFKIVKLKSVVLRTEETVPLYGILYVLESI